MKLDRESGKPCCKCRQTRQGGLSVLVDSEQDLFASLSILGG
jgi:hypothetical protein